MWCNQFFLFTAGPQAHFGMNKGLRYVHVTFISVSYLMNNSSIHSIFFIKSLQTHLTCSLPYNIFTDNLESLKCSYACYWSIHDRAEALFPYMYMPSNRLFYQWVRMKGIVFWKSIAVIFVKPFFVLPDEVTFLLLIPLRPRFVSACLFPLDELL